MVIVKDENLMNGPVGVVTSEMRNIVGLLVPVFRIRPAGMVCSWVGATAATCPADGGPHSVLVYCLCFASTARVWAPEQAKALSLETLGILSGATDHGLGHCPSGTILACLRNESHPHLKGKLEVSTEPYLLVIKTLRVPVPYFLLFQSIPPELFP